MISDSFWRGKSVIVTGGSSGIGRALASAVAAGGGRVGLVARRGETLAATVAEIAGRGGVADAEACDVAHAEDLRRAASALGHRLGPCDVAIAAAGIHRTTWPLDAAVAGEVIDTNVKGVVNLAAAVLPGMLARGQGSFCGVSSIAAVVGLPGNAGYCASKAAVSAFLEALRLDAAPRGVRITTALPGVVDTPMITAAERAAGGIMTADEAAARIAAAVARGDAEVWFPRRTAWAARLARSLPPMLRDAILRRQTRLEEAGDQPPA